MLNKISPAQFRFIYQEITGDNSKADTQKQAEHNECICCIIKNTDPALCQDLCISNGKKIKFDSFWDIAKNVMKELTAVDDKRHTQGSTTSSEVVVNMAIAISAHDLYDKCKNTYLKKQLPENEIPSFSWFKFQFWPKDSTTHLALNCMGCFPVKYMLQQRMIRKAHDDDHYTNAIFKYAREYAVSIRDICSLVCTDDKHKISMGEPNFLLAALPRGRRVLAANRVSRIRNLGTHFFVHLITFLHT